jgi:hypothetical protein
LSNDFLHQVLIVLFVISTQISFIKILFDVVDKALSLTRTQNVLHDGVINCTSNITNLAHGCGLEVYFAPEVVKG